MKAAAKRQTPATSDMATLSRVHRLSLGSTRNRGGKGMSILAWIVLGLIAGFISSKLVNRHGEGLFLDIILGVVGAVVGGWLMAALGGEGVNGFNLYSILVAIV